MRPVLLAFALAVATPACPAGVAYANAPVADVYFHLALNLHANGKGRDALEAMQRAAASDPGHAAARYWLGRLRESHGEATPAQAAVLYRQAIRADPSLADAYFFLGRALAHDGRRTDAVSVLRAGSTLTAAGRARHRPEDFERELRALAVR